MAHAHMHMRAHACAGTRVTVCVLITQCMHSSGVQDGSTALILAARKGQAPVLNLLMSKGAIVDVKKEVRGGNRTCLGAAQVEKHVPVRAVACVYGKEVGVMAAHSRHFLT